MKDRYLKLTTSFITKYHTYDDDELDKLRYGLEGIYLSVTKLIIITLIAIIIGIIKEFILLLIFCNEKLIYLKNKKNDLANSAFINYRNKNTEYVII